MNDLTHASVYEIHMAGLSNELYRHRQAWACGTAPDAPWLNPYARRSERMWQIKSDPDPVLWDEVWQAEERADDWEHRSIMDLPVHCNGVYAEID